jgi:tetratricopeptide (TPR) repeat protein
MKKLALFAGLCALIFGMVFAVVAQAADDIQAGVELGKKLDYKGATTVYEKILVSDPKNYDALWMAADNYIKLGIMAKDADKAALYEKAADLAGKAVEISPDKIEGHVKLAIAKGRLALFKGGKIKVQLSKDVKAEAEKALQINPKNDEALHTLGSWHREVATLPGILKMFAKILYGGLPPASKDEAVKYLEEATAINPKVVEHHLELGKCYMTVGKWDLAKKAWNDCIALTPVEAYDKTFQAEARSLLAQYKGEKG